MIGRSIMFAVAGIVCASPAMAQSVAPRSVVPIREVVIPDGGDVRYAITITVNGVPFEVGLDTGSTGLRLLPRAVRNARVEAGEQPERYSYTSGVLLQGSRTMARVRLGAAAGIVAIHAIERVSCVQAKPDCPASRIPPQAYGLMGSGRPRAGFPAIVGIRLQEGRIPNPMAALGVRRWIVHLPQHGQGDGLLVLNPDARDTAGFVSLRPGAGSSGTVGSCLMALAPPPARICGPTLLDTGAPGLTVRGAKVPSNWAPQLPARITFVPEAAGSAPALTFRSVDRAHGAHATFMPDRHLARPEISAGTLPFYAFDVLFDGDHQTIAVRPNRNAGPAVRPAAGAMQQR